MQNLVLKKVTDNRKVVPWSGCREHVSSSETSYIVCPNDLNGYVISQSSFCTSSRYILLSKKKLSLTSMYLSSKYFRTCTATAEKYNSKFPTYSESAVLIQTVSSSNAAFFFTLAYPGTHSTQTTIHLVAWNDSMRDGLSVWRETTETWPWPSVDEQTQRCSIEPSFFFGK